MGAFPSDDLTTLQLDGTGDDPSQARVELLAAIQKLQALIASYNDNSGICPLDASGVIPDANVDATAMTALLNIATTSLKGLMSAADKVKLSGIATGANLYVLPEATDATLGGVKEGSGVTITSGVLSADTQISDHSAGSYVIGAISISLTGTHAYTERVEWKVARAGEVRIRVGYISTSGAGNVVYVRVLRNGSVWGTPLTGVSTSWVWSNYDVTVSVGDLIQVETSYTYYDGTASAKAAIMTGTPIDTGTQYPYVLE